MGVPGGVLLQGGHGRDGVGEGIGGGEHHAGEVGEIGGVGLVVIVAEGVVAGEGGLLFLVEGWVLLVLSLLLVLLILWMLV